MGDIGELKINRVKPGERKKDPNRALQQHPLLSKGLQGARSVLVVQGQGYSAWSRRAS